MANDVGLTEALHSLKPNAWWELRDDVLTWVDEVQTEPTQLEIDAEIVRLQAEHDSQEYARNRRPEYPDIGDQLDDLFHKGAFSTEMAAQLQAVKDKYPKE